MAAHDIAHDLGVLRLLHTHVTWSLQAVKAHDPREFGLDRFLILVHRQYSNLQRLTVSAFSSKAPKLY